MEKASVPSQYSRLRTAAKAAPLEPGVYLMRDDAGVIIYIGKARLLRHRLLSYFSGQKDAKTRTLVRRVASFETIIVDNEYSALILENTLIKQHSPKYNINLKDGKSYPVVRVTNEKYPRVFRTRRIVEDGSLYYGPYTNIAAIDAVLDLAAKLFPLRKCRLLKKRTVPCMYYHIGRCSAPCCGKISEADYAVHVERVKKILSGDSQSLRADLTNDMLEAAAAMKFEQAAQLRDMIRALEQLNAATSVVDFDPEARDYIAWAAEGVLASFSVFSLRGGQVTGRELFRGLSAADDLDTLESFLTGYYGADHPPPPTIYLGGIAFNQALDRIRRWFDEQFQLGDCLQLPDEKRHEVILAMARQNALEDLRQRLRERGAGPALDELRSSLGLRRRPEQIEGFDIAQLDGKYTVASLVSFKDGKPDRKNYRHFKIRTTEGQVDDYGAIREAVSRRYSRRLAEGADLPDLILIDGGIGQVNAARVILEALELKIDLVGLAKRDEELWLPGLTEPIRLSRRSEALKLLQFVRDESHRFATSLNQRLRSKALNLKQLERINGIGAKRAAGLLKSFGSMASLAAAAPAEIASRCRLSLQLAEAVTSAARQALADTARQKDRLGRFQLNDELATLAAEALSDYRAEEAP